MISGSNFLVIYLGLELLTLSSYALVALRRDNAVASEAAMKKELVSNCPGSRSSRRDVSSPCDGSAGSTTWELTLIIASLLAGDGRPLRPRTVGVRRHSL